MADPDTTGSNEDWSIESQRLNRGAAGPLDDIRTVWREGDKLIYDVSDMTFGQYVRLLGNNDNWSKMPLDIDRGIFTKKLDEVREARNEVMHFEPEGIEPEKLKVLREFARFLHKFG